MLDREVDPREVVLVDRRQAGVGAGEIQPLMGGESPADLDLAADRSVARLLDPKLDRAVGEIDLIVALEGF